MEVYDKDNPLRVFTAFSGYDSQCLSLERLKDAHPEFAYELVGWSEIDKQAITAHNLLFPKCADRNFGDISKIDWSTVPDFDLFTYSFPCFVAGTLILTTNGYKNIEDIVAQDVVLTHANKWRCVVKPMRHSYSGALYRFNAMAFDELVCTAEHPLYVRKKSHVWKNGRRLRIFGEPEWRRACETDKSYYVGYAINTNSNIPEWNGVEDNRWGHHKTTNKLKPLLGVGWFWYLMGRYIGDGWKRASKTGKGIVICCSQRNKATLLKCAAELGFNATISEERTVTKVIISSSELYAFVERYGYKAYGKCIDGQTMSLPVTLLRRFIDGYIDSDGCTINGLIKISSVSRTLIFGIAQCVAKCYKRPFSIYKTRRKPKVMIEGRIVNQKDSYSISWKPQTDIQDKAFYENGLVWFPINSIKTEYTENTTVYNMEVEDDNSYTANGAIAHNCTDLSAAGRMAGFTEGSGTRSSLLWECRKAIAEKRPKYMLLENVKDLANRKNLPLFNKWLRELEDYGYANYWQVIDAKDHGVPQSRRRVFAVSVRKDLLSDYPYGYKFPKPYPLEKLLEDVLQDEDEVDDKYYLHYDNLLDGNV